MGGVNTVFRHQVLHQFHKIAHNLVGKAPMAVVGNSHFAGVIGRAYLNANGVAVRGLAVVSTALGIVLSAAAVPSVAVANVAVVLHRAAVIHDKVRRNLLRGAAKVRGRARCTARLRGHTGGVMHNDVPDCAACCRRGVVGTGFLGNADIHTRFVLLFRLAVVHGQAVFLNQPNQLLRVAGVGGIARRLDRFAGHLVVALANHCRIPLVRQQKRAMVGNAFCPTVIGTEQRGNGGVGCAVVTLLGVLAVRFPAPPRVSLNAKQGVGLGGKLRCTPAAFQDCLRNGQTGKDSAFLHIGLCQRPHHCEKFSLFHTVSSEKERGPHPQLSVVFCLRIMRRAYRRAAPLPPRPLPPACPPVPTSVLGCGLWWS